MEVNFKVGDLVVNKADKKTPYTVIEINTENQNALIADALGNEYRMRLVILEKYEPPKGPSIRSLSNRW